MFIRFIETATNNFIYVETEEFVAVSTCFCICQQVATNRDEAVV
jgi:hypothetical protein